MGWLSRKKDEQRNRQTAHGSRDYTFRRSRTLTGSTSATIRTSAERLAQLKTPRLEVHELHQERVKIVRYLSIVLLSIVLLSFLIANYTANLTIVYDQQPSKTGPPDASAYREALQKYFAGRPLQRFGFMLNTRELEDFIRAERPELSGFEVTHTWYGGSAQFVAYFRKPLLTWQTGKERFYVDGQGTAFTYDYFDTPLVSVEDKSGIAPDSGGSVASQRFIVFLGKLVGAVNAGNKGQVSGIVIPTSTREIDLKLQGREYPVKTHIDRDPLQQAEDIINALSYFDSRHIVPAYVDVRVDGEAFYK